MTDFSDHNLHLFSVKEKKLTEVNLSYFYGDDCVLDGEDAKEVYRIYRKELTEKTMQSMRAAAVHWAVAAATLLPLGNSDGFVGGARIEHHDFFGPVHLAQAGIERIRVVIGDHHHRQRFARHASAPRSAGTTYSAAHQRPSNQANNKPHQAE